MKNLKKIVLILVALASAATLAAGCASKADVASSNLSKAAEQFQVYRRIVFINGITDKYLFEIDGYCSVETTDSKLGGSLEVTCKVDRGFKKDYLGLSDNVTYVVQQLDAIKVSDAHYRVLFRPETVVPDFTR